MLMAEFKSLPILVPQFLNDTLFQTVQYPVYGHTQNRSSLADAAHDLRTPLTAMRGIIDVTLNRPRAVHEYENVLTQLRGEVDRLTKLVDDLLTMARLDDMAFVVQEETLNLTDLLEAVVDQMRHLAMKKGIALELHSPDQLKMTGDATLLIRLFLNLLDNAVKYTPPGGRVVVQASIDESMKDREKLGSESKYVIVTVEDTGPGITEEDLKQIFERFYRADKSRSRVRGSGLGLSIVRKIVELHGGEIHVESQVGKGSTFTVHLPLLPPLCRAPKMTMSPEVSSRRQMKTTRRNRM